MLQIEHLMRYLDTPTAKSGLGARKDEKRRYAGGRRRRKSKRGAIREG